MSSKQKISVLLSENTLQHPLWSRNGMSAVVTCICSQLELAEWESCLNSVYQFHSTPEATGEAGMQGRKEKVCVGGVVKEKEN